MIVSAPRLASKTTTRVFQIGVAYQIAVSVFAIPLSLLFVAPLAADLAVDAARQRLSPEAQQSLEIRLLRDGVVLGYGATIGLSVVPFLVSWRVAYLRRSKKASTYVLGGAVVALLALGLGALVSKWAMGSIPPIMPVLVLIVPTLGLLSGWFYWLYARHHWPLSDWRRTQTGVGFGNVNNGKAT